MTLHNSFDGMSKETQQPDKLVKNDPISNTPTAWKVDCSPGFPSCGESFFLTQEEYTRQLENNHRFWQCPCCGQDAAFDSDHKEAFGKTKVLAI